MGNCVSTSSCSFLNQKLAAASTSNISVLQPTEGRVVDIELPEASQACMKVGELLLEFPPGHFIAQLDRADLFQQLPASHCAKRPAPLGADSDAKPGAVYVLFPMPRLHTRISPQELLALANLLRNHEQPASTKAASLCKLPQTRSLFTAGARVAPLSLEQVDGLIGDGKLPGIGANETDQDGTTFCNFQEIQRSQQQQQQQQQVQEGASFDSVSTRFGGSCHGPLPQQQVSFKFKPWAPKLETIQESS